MPKEDARDPARQLRPQTFDRKVGVRNVKKVLDRIVDGSTALVNRYMPDAFVLAIALTIVVFIIAIPVTGIDPAEGVSVFDRLVNLVYEGWFGSFWDLLAFAMQMALIIVTGSVFASAPPIHRFIVRIASIPKTPKQAVLFVAVVGMLTYFIQWGAAMIICAILAKEVAKRVEGVHYPLLVAAAYVGNALWHGGLSGTIPLYLADGWSFEGIWSTDGIPFSETVFAPYNLFIYIVGAIVLSALVTAMHPSREKTIAVDPAVFAEDEVADSPLPPRSEMTFAERVENSRLLNRIIVAIGLVCIAWYFFDLLFIKQEGFSLSINIVNFIFLFVAMGLHGTPIKVVRAVSQAVRSVGGIMLQFPFYAGIAGLMGYAGGSTGVSIAQVIAEFFVNISNGFTFPIFTFISSGIVKMFIPSGGAHWAVQGPIVMSAVQSFLESTSEAKAAMALAWGNCWGNLLQPFWLLPVLEVAKLKIRDVMGYLVICFVVLFFVILAGMCIPG